MSDFGPTHTHDASGETVRATRFERAMDAFDLGGGQHERVAAGEWLVRPGMYAAPFVVPDLVFRACYTPVAEGA